eukprot:scaffold69828_cov45-Prasinocladus_malaysianus.AAC.3
MSATRLGQSLDNAHGKFPGRDDEQPTEPNSPRMDLTLPGSSGRQKCGSRRMNREQSLLM